MGTEALHLFRLVSTTLPVGAYSYSRGLESAVEAADVFDGDSAASWLSGVLARLVAPVDVAVLVRQHRALRAGDLERVLTWDAWLTASRESRELQLEDQQMGRALFRLLRELGALEGRDAAACAALSSAGFTTLFAVAAHHHGVPERDAALGYLWALADNQVSCAVRLVPLGQTTGQRVLCQLIEALPAMVAEALTLPDADIGAFAPGLALLSAQHETQYSRLFRS